MSILKIGRVPFFLRSISPFLTPFDHSHFCPTLGLVWSQCVLIQSTNRMYPLFKKVLVMFVTATRIRIKAKRMSTWRRGNCPITRCSIGPHWSSTKDSNYRPVMKQSSAPGWQWHRDDDDLISKANKKLDWEVCQSYILIPLLLHFFFFLNAF